MGEIQPPRLLPIQPKLVFVTSGGDVWMPAGLHIRIHANGNSKAPRSPRRDMARGFLQQDFQLCFRFNVEKKNPAVARRFRVDR